MDSRKNEDYNKSLLSSCRISFSASYLICPVLFSLESGGGGRQYQGASVCKVDEAIRFGGCRGNDGKENSSRYHHGSLRKAALREAHRIPARKGADRVTVRAIARGVGVTPNALYRHFRARMPC